MKDYQAIQAFNQKCLRTILSLLREGAEIVESPPMQAQFYLERTQRDLARVCKETAKYLKETV